MPLLNTRELKDKYKNQRTAFVEEAVEAGMPFSAYADAEYDPEKDGELGADDARLTAMEVICDELDMTTMCNPAAGIWPTRCEDVVEDPAKMFALKEMSLNIAIAALPISRKSKRQPEKKRVVRVGNVLAPSKIRTIRLRVRRSRRITMRWRTGTRTWR